MLPAQLMFIFGQLSLSTFHLNLLALHLADVSFAHVVFKLLTFLVPNRKSILNFSLFVLYFNLAQSVPLGPLFIFLVQTLLRLAQLLFRITLVGLLNLFLLCVGLNNGLTLFSQSVDLLVLSLF